MVARSINELHSAFFKALRGASLSGTLAGGHEAELATALLAMQAARQDGVALTIDLCGQGKDQSGLRMEPALLFSEYDLAVADGIETSFTVKSEGCALFLAIAATYGVEQGCTTRARSGEEELEISSFDDLATVLGAVNQTADGTWTISVTPPDSSAKRNLVFSPAGPIELPDEEWVMLQNLAARTYVPANEHSRSFGAGAGLNDND